MVVFGETRVTTMFHPPPPPPQEPPLGSNNIGVGGGMSLPSSSSFPASLQNGQQQQQQSQVGSVSSSSSNQPPPPIPSVTSAFPDPPSQYVNKYTDENVSKGMVPLPPKPITEGSYSMFGSVVTCDDSIIRPLESQGIRRLYPREFDHKKELKKMNHSILVNFLDLLDIMVKCPDTPKREEKCGDINMLFIQMHHLINELRPHQARETIRVTLKCQKRQRLATAISMNQQIEKVTEAIANHLTVIPDSLLELKATIEQDVERLRQLCLSEQADEVPDDPVEDMVQLDSIMCGLVSNV